MSEPAQPVSVPVVIAGGGPVGLTLAALLGRHGVRTLVLEADAGYCVGSRAICLSRRSQEIFGWIDADRALVAGGLPWSGGRSHFRDAEVLHFTMPSDPTERYAPMLNIPQFAVEAIAHGAAVETGKVDVAWSTRAVAVRPGTAGVEVDTRADDGTRRTVHADWLVACDGGRSTVREQLGLRFEGTQYEGRYVIVDIEQESARPVERLAWFDPPSNPGSTILMHRQPGHIWRIDYQIDDGDDPAEAIRPENVLPRVESHLRMIGETAPWKPLWISLYNAKCLTLDAYRHGRVLFAGDAAHLVPIFGVRGLNSGLDDAANLAWKLARVVGGRAGETLLDSYSHERVAAARQNIAFGAKSTEFMAPPHAGFRLMRDAALRLATETAPVRSLINPRQSTPVRYADSPLNAGDRPDGDGPRAGDPAPEARLRGGHLSQHFGDGFVALWFSDAPASLGAAASVLAGTALRRITRDATDPDPCALCDLHGEAWQRFGAADGTLVLVRPDGYLLGRWAHPTAGAACIAAALAAAGADPVTAGVRR